MVIVYCKFENEIDENEIFAINRHGDIFHDRL